ncbi:hypothetical protein Hanom_Chr07g00588761 [Helianthus anomalus]
MGNKWKLERHIETSLKSVFKTYKTYNHSTVDICSVYECIHMIHFDTSYELKQIVWL